MEISVLFFLVTFVATSHAQKSLCPLYNPIRLPGNIPLPLGDRIPNLLHGLELRSRTGGESPVNCSSWLLNVDIGNVNEQDWYSTPTNCIEYVANYMCGKPYTIDCDFTADLAISYANEVPTYRDGKDIWIFDVDETSLSNLPLFASPDFYFGKYPLNITKAYDWMEKGSLPAIPSTLRLYKEVKNLGFGVIFLTGLADTYKVSRASNLQKAGYTNYIELIMRTPAEMNKTAEEYKTKRRTELEEKEGYRIIGNIGDSWEDIMGAHRGKRTFKMPTW